MSVTNHTITVTVNGIDKTTSLAKDSVFIRFQLNRRSNVAELKFINYEPADRSEVQISINGTVVFGGYITRKSATLQGVKGQSNVVWSCDCKDWSELFETVTVSGQYTSQEDRQIVMDLFSVLTGFTFDSTKTLKLNVTTNFENVSLKDALDQLAKISGANWYVKPNKDLYWFSPVTPDKISFIISSSPNDTTKFGFQDGSLTYDLDSSTIINQIKFISGVRSTGSKTSDTFNGDGSTKKFSLSQIPDSILFCSYNDGTGSYVTYGSFVGQAPGDKLISQGGTKTVVLDLTNQTIELEGNSGLAPANSTSIIVEYYSREKVEFSVDDLYSQEEFGVFPYIVRNKEIDNPDNLEQIAESLLEQNSYAKPSIKFDTTQYGLMPGLLLELDIPELNLESATQTNRLLSENRSFGFGLENDDYVLREQAGVGRSFIIQEVSITPIYTPTGFMLVSQVTCGKWTGSLVDSLTSLSELKSSVDRQPNPIPTQLSNVSSNLGEVVVGRATFTDGGTAPFNWGTPNGASGVVVGLEDRTNAHGAMYVYAGGTVKAKLGNMTGLPVIGTFTPSGWGLYTENGYFTGVVAASRLIGGTVTGSLITGNTLTGGTITGSYISGGTINAGVLHGGTITGSYLDIPDINGAYINASIITSTTMNTGTVYAASIFSNTLTGNTMSANTLTGNTIIGGTIATSTPPINSSNPGVIMDSSGLYGYGTAGLTFRLSTNPAIRPYFSSGTIENAVYEVTTQSVLRTGTTNPRIQIDNSGIFAYNSSGSLKFQVDTASGRLTASDGIFSGSVTASQISGGTVSGVQITGNQITGGTITSGVLNSNTINVSTFNTSNFNTGTVNASIVTASIVQSSTLQSNNITSNTIYGNTITGNTVSGGTVTGNHITGGTITGVQITGNQINGGTVTGGLISGGTVTGALVQAASGNVYLDSAGLNLVTTGSYAYGDQRNIKWRSSVGGSIAVELAGSWNGTYAELWNVAGYPNFRYGIIHTQAYNNAGFGYTEIQQYPTQWTYLIDGNFKFQVDNSAITTWLNIIPDSSANNRQLGNSTNGFRYLYLKDDNGNVRRIHINSSGVLTVT